MHIKWYSPRKLTCHLKNRVCKNAFLLKWTLIRGHVGFRGCIYMDKFRHTPRKTNVKMRKNDNLKMYLLWKKVLFQAVIFFSGGYHYGCPFPHFSCFFEAMPSHKVLEKRTPEMRDWRPKCNDSESHPKNWNPDDLAGQNHGNLRVPTPPKPHPPRNKDLIRP